MILYLKAFHIIFVVAWFAELFYIFRLFVYHVKFREKPELCQAYEQMERKLIYMIGHPAMGFTLLTGIWMIVKNPALLQEKWLHFKFLGVVCLMAYQIFSGITRRQFVRRNFFLSEKTCRIVNEVPTFLLVLIVILVVVKPF